MSPALAALLAVLVVAVLSVMVSAIYRRLYTPDKFCSKCGAAIVCAVLVHSSYYDTKTGEKKYRMSTSAVCSQYRSSGTNFDGTNIKGRDGIPLLFASSGYHDGWESSNYYAKVSSYTLNRATC
jgi:hypothetical protein